jgi:hypothetical protein
VVCLVTDAVYVHRLRLKSNSVSGGELVCTLRLSGLRENQTVRHWTYCPEELPCLTCPFDYVLPFAFHVRMSTDKVSEILWTFSPRLWRISKTCHAQYSKPSSEPLLNVCPKYFRLRSFVMNDCTITLFCLMHHNYLKFRCNPQEECYFLRFTPSYLKLFARR